MEIAAFLEFFFALKLGHGLLRVINTRKWIKTHHFLHLFGQLVHLRMNLDQMENFVTSTVVIMYTILIISILTCIMFSTALVFVIKPETK